MPNFLYKYPKANPIPPLNKKHRSTINGVSVVIAIVLGRCPAANNKATITFTIICTFSGISLFSMSITFEAIKTSNDIRNNLIIISSVTPPVNKPASIFEMAGAASYCSYTQLFKDQDISLSPGNNISADATVITAVITIACLSYLNSFHRLTFLEIINPINASIPPNTMPYCSNVEITSKFLDTFCSCSLFSISGDSVSYTYNPVQYPQSNWQLRQTIEISSFPLKSFYHCVLPLIYSIKASVSNKYEQFYRSTKKTVSKKALDKTLYDQLFQV